MGLFDNFKKAEVRSLENPNAPVSAENFLHIMGWGDFQSSAGVTVNIDNALGVPAVWAAVNFISGTLASLPLEVYRGNQRVTDGIGAWLNRAINPTTSSFQWRKYSYEQVLTGGRSVTLILRNGRGDVTDLVPLDPADLHVQEQVTAEFRLCQNKPPCPTACWILAFKPCLNRYLFAISKPVQKSFNLQLCCM